ncbi:MAG: hypothetical protein ABSB69_20430, partial [Solirubrobacteraceae bacterium]
PFFQPSTRLSHSISFFPDVITPLLFPKDSNFPKPLNLSGRDTGVGSECLDMPSKLTTSRRFNMTTLRRYGLTTLRRYGLTTLPLMS